jgi:hypothetical protein
MITRGYFIGQIIDELTAVAHQVETRGRLQLFDLNRYLEDFYKGIFNIAYGLNLKNLNEERSNNPGLDLGDEAEGIAYQITSNKLGAKVNETLQTVSKNPLLIKKYPAIYVFMVRKKQDSYVLKKPYADKLKFTTANILDVDDLLRDILGLPIDKLQEVFDRVTRDVARVKIELEIPDKNGKFQTNIDQYIEAIPRERFDGAASYLKYIQSVSKNRVTLDLTEEDVEQDFKDFIKRLKKLPRITRQVYSFLLRRGEWDRNQRYMNTDVFERILTFPDKQGEVRILTEYGFLIYKPIEEDGDEPIFKIETVKDGYSPNFTLDLMRFMKAKSIDLDKVVVSLDFSDFN